MHRLQGEGSQDFLPTRPLASAARTGWRAMLRNVMTIDCESTLSILTFAGRTRRKLGGAGGCIATAGARVTTSRSARSAPTIAATTLSVADNAVRGTRHYV